PVSISVLSNDLDAESPLNPESLVIVQPPLRGVVVLDPETGTIQYTPNVNYSGSDSFTYRMRDVDGFLSNEAFVQITVAPVADPPFAAAFPAHGDQDSAIPLLLQ